MVRRLLVLGALVVVFGAGCSSGGGPSTVSTAPVAPTTPAVPSVTGTVATLPVARPEGFTAVTLRVTGADGTVHESCVLLADDDAKRARGLMDVDNLGGYDGMIFRFDSPIEAMFYMYRTRLPLSIAFFDRDGRYVSASDMPPCTATRARDCPVYGAARPYTDALEVPQGGLGALGVAAGSRIDVGGACSRSP